MVWPFSTISKLKRDVSRLTSERQLQHQQLHDAGVREMSLYNQYAKLKARFDSMCVREQHVTEELQSLRKQLQQAQKNDHRGPDGRFVTAKK
jgi:chromosome segregation ATPase